MSDGNRRGRGRRGFGDDPSADDPSVDGSAFTDDGGDEAQGPTDLAAVIRDNELLDALAGTGPVATESAEEFEIAALLSRWRDEIVTPPMPAGPDLDTVEAKVLAEIASVKRGGHRHSRRLTPLVAGAAAVAALLGGMTVLAHQSKPGDALWGVNRTLFGDQTSQAASVTDIKADLDQAEKMIGTGQIENGLRKLDDASSRLQKVRTDPRFHDLDQRRTQLWARATGRPASAAPVVGAPSTTTKPAPSVPATGGPTSVPAPNSPSVPVFPLPLPGHPTIPWTPPTLPMLPLRTATPAPPTTTVPQPTETTTPTSTTEPSTPTETQAPAPTSHAGEPTTTSSGSAPSEDNSGSGATSAPSGSGQHHR